MGGTSEGVSLAVYLFESDHKPTSYDWLGSESFAYYVEIVDRMLDVCASVPSVAKIYSRLAHVRAVWT